MEEIWQNIEGFEGIYQVSNQGNVRSLDRMVEHSNKVLRLYKGKTLTLKTDKYGYKRVGLSYNGNVTYYQVHRLVYETFCGKIPEGMQVNHINEDKTDNRLCNLNLMTPKENCNWGTRTNRIAKTRSKPVVGCDSEGNVVVTFQSAKEAGRKGYNESTIYNCCNGKRNIHTHKGLYWKYLS